MSGNPQPFYTLQQGGPAPAQALQGQGNPMPLNQANGHGAVPRSMGNNQQHPQYQQQQQQQHFQHMYSQYQQPNQAGESRNTPERRRAGRVSAISDIRQDCMTEDQMRESLAEYIVYRLAKAPVNDDVDQEGYAAQPTWEKVDRKVLPRDKYEATQDVLHLTEQKSVQERLAKLGVSPRQQVNELLAELEEVEEDKRYCYVIAQLDQELVRIPIEQYLRDRRNWNNLSEKELKRARQLLEGDKNRKKAASNSKVKNPKDKDGKTEQKKETKSVTVYVRRIPKPDEDIVAMYEEVTRFGRATQPRVSPEKEYQQRQGIAPAHQQMHPQQHHSFQQPQHSQYSQHSQSLQQSQYAPQYPQQHLQLQQHPQQQHPQQQQYYNLSQQAQQQPRPAQQAQMPIPPPPTPPAVPKGQGKPIAIPHGPAQKHKGEPFRVVDVSPTTKNKHREKRYSGHSARSSKSSFYSEDDDIFSMDSETSRSSMPSDDCREKDNRGRTKKRGKGRRVRDESTDSSRNRRKPTHRPEAYGFRQHTVDHYGVYGSSHVRRPSVPPPPAPPSTEDGAFPPETLATVFRLGKMEGQRQAGVKGTNDPVSPRIVHATRPVMRDSEDDFDGVRVGGRVREGLYERRAYDRHDGSGVRPAEVYQQPRPVPRAPGNQFRQAPAHAYGGEYPSAPSEDYSEEYEDQYTHAPPPGHRPQPRTRPQSPERRGHEQAFRHTQHAGEPYMSGGLRYRAEVRNENPFMPRPQN